jgi:hypothetical protein
MNRIALFFILITSCTLLSNNNFCSAESGSGKENSLSNVCGDQTYNPLTHVCCFDFLHEIVEGYKCCQRGYYDPAKQICCRDRYGQPGGLGQIGSFCCGGVPYTPGGQYVCCGDELSGKLYDPTKRNCCIGSEENTVYDPLISGCCNGKSYDLEKEGCCGGEVYDKGMRKCCKDTIYSTVTHECCNHNNLCRINQDGLACCDYNKDGVKEECCE